VLHALLRVIAAGAVPFAWPPCRPSPNIPAIPVTTPDINAADLAARDKAIADDAFEGRGPGTKNGEAAAEWIADEMKRIGLKPGNHGSYFQDVPSVSITLDAAKSSLSSTTPQGALTPKFPDEAVYWTPQFKATRSRSRRAAGLRRLRRRRAGISLERLCRRRCEGKDGRHPDQRPGQRGRQPRSRISSRARR
jgi:hypothetical protein